MAVKPMKPEAVYETALAEVEPLFEAEENTPNHKNVFIRLFFSFNVFVYSFFIFSTLIFPLMLENNRSVDTGCYYDLDQTELELAFTERSEYIFSFYQLNSSQKQTAGFTPANVHFSAVHKTSLIFYNNFVRHQLKLFNRTFTPQPQLVSILQKNNIWHQSSDEDPSLFS
ncbi:hypothetical protein ACFLXQ_05235 [Chloroflexota bacterium]